MQSYRYAIDDGIDESGDPDAIEESPWGPLALGMKQSRNLHISMLNNKFWKPLHRIIQGEGGFGKSWVIKHIVKDVQCGFGENSRTRQISRRICLLAHQGMAAFKIKGQPLS